MTLAGVALGTASLPMMGTSKPATTGGVQIGVCNSHTKWDLIQKAGCEYIEDNVGKLLSPPMSNADFAEAAAAFKAKNVPVHACNGFLPGELKLVGPESRHDEAVAYATRAIQRAKMLGIKIVVLGSGAARQVPDGFSKSQAVDQFLQVTARIASVAAQENIMIAMESLNQSETNFGNTMKECLQYAISIKNPHFGLTADMYHMLREEEGPEILVEAGARIVHCHIAEKAARTPPGTAQDDFRPYLRALKKIGYQGRISLECRWKDFEAELAPAVSALRKQLEAVYAEA
jgi:sugar phosphate isomerase/epimerase